MKDSDVEWVRNRWPLVELNMSRFDCIEWLQRNGYPVPPKSSCLGCPYHGDDFWNRLKRDSPAEFADTVKVDQAIRDTKVAGMTEQQYMHRSLLPLDQVRLRNGRRAARSVRQRVRGDVWSLRRRSGVR